ncbi:MBL fold metallo-hydrolase [Paenibacillus chitinolyticus]|uniref:MBL fold metallo-hydrolase n=1 Tax=Paenibacillus chitinolyticus TaxID=79263 RepID=UPI001C46068E|nr:MBL fold metallo-hydrolase [Paenibacillus chitinolyticus]MBV6716664.1 MBL fold metallo-hydrolase [Paenibacillus chitinolyticus]
MNRKRYTNMDPAAGLSTFSDLRKWRKERSGKVKDLSFVIKTSPDKDPGYLKANRSETTITWIGHSTFLLQKNGINLVTDPVWASRMGFDKRLAEPGLKLGELPPVDAVLLSHGHYDHLHIGSLRALPGKPKLLVPEGLGKTLRRKGFDDIQELSWWGSHELGGLRLHFVPAQHWTRRSLTDTNTSHWGGWIIEDAGKPGADPDSLYFAGDSGYFQGFRMIGEQFRIGCALMPIGAYEPEWFMSTQHVSPEEAVQAFLDTQADIFVPMHYGSFRLADDTPQEALDRLRLNWEQRKLDPQRLKVLLHGQTLKTALSGAVNKFPAE